MPKSRQPRGSTLRPRATTCSMEWNSNPSGYRKASERLPADVRHLDLRDCSRLLGSKLGVAVGAARPDRLQLLGDLLVGGAEAERGAEVVAARGEEAGVEPSLGREPRAGAAPAEGLRHRCDDADLARAVEVAPAPRGRVGTHGRHRLERPA